MTYVMWGLCIEVLVTLFTLSFMKVAGQADERAEEMMRRRGNKH